jgi:hypothetical protein
MMKNRLQAQRTAQGKLQRIWSWLKAVDEAVHEDDRAADARRLRKLEERAARLDRNLS